MRHTERGFGAIENLDQDEAIENLLVAALEAGGVQECYGPKPPGYLEDAAQKLLDADKKVVT